MTDQNPLPCPFCGGSDIMEKSQEMTEGPDHVWFICTACYCEIDSHAGRDKAITAWNTRAHRPGEQEAVEQLRFMAKNLRLPDDRMFDFHILAHERNEVADNIERLPAASPPSRALSPDEREAVERVRGLLECVDDRQIDAIDVVEEYERDQLSADLTTLLNILQPEGEANG